MKNKILGSTFIGQTPCPGSDWVARSYRMPPLAESVAWWRQPPISLVNPADRRLLSSGYDMGGYTTSAGSYMY